MKICTKCHTSKSSNQFGKIAKLAKKQKLWCIKCCSAYVVSWRSMNKKKHTLSIAKWRQRNKNRLAIQNHEWHMINRSGKSEYNRIHQIKNYSLTLDKYNAMVNHSGGRCFICGTHFAKLLRTLNIDHDHNCCYGNKSCGKCVRGLLCDNCNRGIGCFKEDINHLKKAVAYMKRGAFNENTICS